MPDTFADQSVKTPANFLDPPVRAVSKDEFIMCETIVFWDIDDCPIPRNLDAFVVSENIRKALEKSGYRGSVTIYPYGFMEGGIMDEFDGFCISPMYPGQTDYRRKTILADLFKCAIDNRNKPINLMLIVGDISRQMGYIMAIHSLKSQQIYNVLLAQPQNTSELLHDAYDLSTQWLWTSLATGGDQIDQSVQTRPSSPVQTRPSSLDESFTNMEESYRNKNLEPLDHYNTLENIVFWDIQDCPIPKGMNAVSVLENIKKALKNIHYLGKVTIYTYVHMDHKHAYDLCHISSTWYDVGDRVSGVRDGRRKSILFDFLNEIRGDCCPKNVMLIVGDISGHMGFIMAIHALLSLKCYNILLAQPQHASGMLHGSVGREWLWTNLATGGGPIDQSESSLLPVDNTCVGSRSLRFLLAAGALVCTVILSR